MELLFPGMNPFLEQSGLWGDFHHTFMVYLRDALQPQLRERKHGALIQHRTYTEDTWRCFDPTKNDDADSAKARTNRPIVLKLDVDEVHRPYLQILDFDADQSLVTVIELLTPAEKEITAARTSYLSHRDERLGKSINFVEIDLLRDGYRVQEVVPRKLDDWSYLVCVRRGQARQDFYMFPLQELLPTVRIPLRGSIDDIPLDLQEVFSKTWQVGPYDQLIDYSKPIDGFMSIPESEWCEQRLRNAGHWSS